MTDTQSPEARSRTFQGYILEKIRDQPTLQIPVQHGDGAGIDTETGWNFTLDGNPTRFYEKKHEWNMMATIIYRTWEKEGHVNADEVYMKLHPDKIQVVGEDNREVKGPDSRVEQPKTWTISETVTDLNAPAPRLPDDFEGIQLLNVDLSVEEQPKLFYAKAQFQCVTRPDLDTTYPDDLPPEVKSKCKRMTLARTTDGYYMAAVDRDNDVTYFESMAKDQYTVVIRDPIIKT